VAIYAGRPKSVTDLINEGLDQVLTARNYSSTVELRSKKS